MRLSRRLGWTLLLLLAVAARAGEALRVGTSGDYPPFSLALPAEDDPDAGPRYAGFDLAIARAFAAAQGREIHAVGFRWPKLAGEFAAGRFDVVMSGITVTPERSALGRFTVPVLETGAVVLVRDAVRHPDLDSLDRREVRIGVNAGGHLERVAEARFRDATLVSIPDNFAVINTFVEGTLDAVVTDTVEAPEWRALAPEAAELGPLTRDRKAYWVHPDQPELAAALDRWLLAAEGSGALAALREEYFGTASALRSAEPIPALFAAIDERLALMPEIAVAKRRAGMPLVVPGREERVLDAGVEAVRRAATQAGVAPPPEDRVRALYRASIEAAKQVQRDALADAGYDRPETTADVDAVLRPALLRIGEKIAGLVVALPAEIPKESVEAAARAQLRTRWISTTSRAEIAAAVAALSQASSLSSRSSARGDAAAP